MRCYVSRVVLVIVALALAACHPGGEYGGAGTMVGNVDRGETNGRMFNFVSHRAEGDDWTIDVRGTSIGVLYANGDKEKKLGNKNLTDKESDKLWELVDKVDIPSRKAGKKDDDVGYVMLRLREPGDERHDIYTVYIPRDNDSIDDDTATLLAYLQKLVHRHFSTDPNF